MLAVSVAGVQADSSQERATPRPEEGSTSAALEGGGRVVGGGALKGSTAAVALALSMAGVLEMSKGSMAGVLEVSMAGVSVLED